MGRNRAEHSSGYERLRSHRHHPVPTTVSAEAHIPTTTLPLSSSNHTQHHFSFISSTSAHPLKSFFSPSWTATTTTQTTGSHTTSSPMAHWTSSEVCFPHISKNIYTLLAWSTNRRLGRLRRATPLHNRHGQPHRRREPAVQPQSRRTATFVRLLRR